MVAGGIKGVIQMTLKLEAYLAGFEVGRRCPPLEAGESKETGASWSLQKGPVLPTPGTSQGCPHYKSDLQISLLYYIHTKSTRDKNL